VAVSGVGGVNGSSYSSSRATTSGISVDALQDQFMTILLAQLRYQDPMAPMQEKDFFGQMAQFTSATSIGEMNKKMDLLVQSFSQSQVSQNLLAASNLIGKAFTAVTDYGLVDGIVDAVALLDGRVHVKSGNLLVPTEDLLAIGVAEYAG
jgi:flagellar basal-body rod modification protein FlgD